MPGRPWAGHGLHSRPRDLFSRSFRHEGHIPLMMYLRYFRTGSGVVIEVNGAIHEGMPHKVYHGRTGIVWDATKRTVGVVMNKQLLVKDSTQRLPLHKALAHPWIVNNADPSGVYAGHN